MVRYLAGVGAVVLVLIPPFAPWRTDAAGDLTTPFTWPVVGSVSAGIQFALRTRWADGNIQYVATITDTKGRLAKYFEKHQDTGQIPLSSFHVAFYDSADFELYTIYFYDRAFSKTEGTADYQANGQSRCDEKLYRQVISASQSAPPGTVTIELAYPTELAEGGPPPAKKR